MAVIESVGRLLVGHPLRILAVGLAFLVFYGGHRALASGTGRSSRAIALAAGLWIAYGVWEWLVITRTQEADIRVDLLILWPVLAIASGWAIFRMLR